MKKKAVRKIPKFKSLEEEANFWDTHSFADYWDEFEDVDLVVKLSKPKQETLVLRLQKDIKDRMKKVARQKGLAISALARLWILEKLHTSCTSLSSSQQHFLVI